MQEEVKHIHIRDLVDQLVEQVEELTQRVSELEQQATDRCDLCDAEFHGRCKHTREFR